MYRLKALFVNTLLRQQGSAEVLRGALKVAQQCGTCIWKHPWNLNPNGWNHFFPVQETLDCPPTAWHRFQEMTSYYYFFFLNPTPFRNMDVRNEQTSDFWGHLDHFYCMPGSFVLMFWVIFVCFVLFCLCVSLENFWTAQWDQVWEQRQPRSPPRISPISCTPLVIGLQYRGAAFTPFAVSFCPIGLFERGSHRPSEIKPTNVEPGPFETISRDSRSKRPCHTSHPQETRTLSAFGNEW